MPALPNGLFSPECTEIYRQNRPSVLLLSTVMDDYI
jgi:hypothetical protein